MYSSGLKQHSFKNPLVLNEYRLLRLLFLLQLAIILCICDFCQVSTFLLASVCIHHTYIMSAYDRILCNPYSEQF